MPRARPYQNNFSAGEFSPRLEGRVDLPRYANAVRTLENFIALPHGGVKRRPGSHFVAAVRDVTVRPRIIRFEFSDTQAYVLEFGQQYLRFYANGGQIADASQIVNGTFDADIAGWINSSTGTGAVSWDSLTQSVLLNAGASGVAQIDQLVTLPVGGTTCTLSVTNGLSTPALFCQVGSAQGGTQYLATQTVPGSTTVSFTFAVSGTAVWVRVGATTAAGLADNISLTRAVYEIATPYLAADLPQLKFVQSADVMTLVHPDYAPHKLTRTAHTAWTLTPITFLPPPTTEELNRPLTTLTPAATTGLNVAFTAGAGAFAAADVDRHLIFGSARAVIQVVDSGTVVHADILDAFPNTNPIPSGSWGINSSPHTTLTPSKKEPAGATVTLTAAASMNWSVGMYVKINDGIVRLTSITSQTVAVGEIVKALSATTAAVAGTWTLEVVAWSATRGYPAATTYHEGRQAYIATSTQPQTVWGSATGDFENFAVGTSAADAYEFTIAANKVNIGRWLLPSRVLLIGTKGGEFRVTGGADLPITPTNVDAKSETAYGSSFTAPVRIGSAILFVQRSGRKLRELSFSLDFDAYVAPDLSVLAEHLFPIGQTIGEMDFQQDPDPVLWAARSDGMLLGLSYDRSNDVVGWHRHPIDGAVESVCVIPHPDGDREQVWLVVRRTIQGGTQRYVEYLDDASGFYGDLGTDCALTYSGAPATVFGGLTHLRGKVVAIVGDGAYYGEQTVPTSGAAEVVISPAASRVEVGLPFTSTLETLRAEIPSQAGTTQGQKKRQSSVIVRVLNTMGIKINGVPQAARRSTDLLGSPPSLVSEDYDGSKLGWDTEARNRIEQTLPFPANILGIFGTVDVAEY